MTDQPDRRPHSRACGYRAHPHGPDCHANCPTCAGRAVPEPMTEPDYDEPRCGVVFTAAVSCRLQHGHSGDHLFNWPNADADAYPWRQSAPPHEA